MKNGGGRKGVYSRGRRQDHVAPGVPFEVTVVCGKDFWPTYEAASAQLERLRKWWPGLRADIRPATVPAPRKKKAVGVGL